MPERRRATSAKRAAVLALLGALPMVSCARSPDPIATSGQPTLPEPRLLCLDPAVAGRLDVRTEPAGSRQYQHRIQVPGSIDYDLERVAKIGAILDGRMGSVTAKVGDRVAKGQVLATMIVPMLANARADYLDARAEAEFSRNRMQRELALSEQDLTTAQEVAVARSELANAEAQLSAAEAKLQALRIPVPQGHGGLVNIGTMSLTSPIDGTVVERNVIVGHYLRPDETAFVVANLSEVSAMLEVFEADVPYLPIGADVLLSTDALPGRTFRARLAAVEPKVGSRSVRARVSVPNPQGLLRPGFFVRASIALPHDAQGLLVPASAVQRLEDGDAVFVARGENRYELRPVRVARRTAEIAELSDGLARGEPIVVNGACLLRSEVSPQ